MAATFERILTKIRHNLNIWPSDVWLIDIKKAVFCCFLMFFGVNQWSTFNDWINIFENLFHSDNVLGLKIHWCENGSHRKILPEVDFFFFIFHLHFQNFFRKFLYDNSPLTNIFSTSTKLHPNSNHIKSYRLSCFHCQLYLNEL